MATIRATTALAIGAVPNLRLVAKQAVDTFLGKSLLPAPDRRAADAGAARHFQHRLSVTREQYDFRALQVLEGVVAIAIDRLEAFDVDGAG